MDIKIAKHPAEIAKWMIFILCAFVFVTDHRFSQEAMKALFIAVFWLTLAYQEFAHYLELGIKNAVYINQRVVAESDTDKKLLDDLEERDRENRKVIAVLRERLKFYEEIQEATARQVLSIYQDNSNE